MDPDAQANEHGASPMRGPDFLLAYIKSFTTTPERDGDLVLSDDSRWRVLHNSQDYLAISGLINLALRKGGLLFVSGNRRTGVVDRVAIPKRLCVVEMAKVPRSGHIAVSFAGPPSIYYLHTDRPWYPSALQALQSSCNGASPLLKPDTIVSIDEVSKEIMDARAANQAPESQSTRSDGSR